jgi:hypothetical protein
VPESKSQALLFDGKMGRKEGDKKKKPLNQGLVRGWPGATE